MIDRRRVLAWALAGATGAGAGPAWSRTGRGRPSRDLEGLWDIGSYTLLERPPELKSLALTPAEAEAFEAPRRALNGMPPSPPGALGQNESEFNERGSGLARVKGQIRSSAIIDPPDGRMPFTAEALHRLGLDTTPPTESFDDPEARPGQEQCLANAAAGAPIVGAADANLLQILQPPGAVVILTEKYHDLRIVRTDGRPRPNPLPPAWMGDSVGRWEGATLVVDTVGQHPGVFSRGPRFYVTGATTAVERFTRVGPAELLYEYTVTDPTLYSQPWRGEMSFHATRGPMFEYACHEGNYGLAGALAGARREEAEAKQRR